MLRKKRNLLITVIVTPLIFIGCSNDPFNINPLETTYISHGSSGIVNITIDSNSESLSSSLGKEQIYSDHNLDNSQSDLTSDHLILKNASGTTTLELSTDCKNITSFIHTDSNNITYDDFSGISYSCTKKTAISGGGSAGWTEYSATPYSLSINGSLTNTQNDTVQVTEGNSNSYITEVFYKYEFPSL